MHIKVLVGSALLVLLFLPAHAQFTTTHFPIYAQAVGDSFEIYVSYKGQLDPHKHYSTVYYSDADIESGEDLRNALEQAGDVNKSLKSTIFIGIGQRGNYNQVRRRDLVPPILAEDGIVQEDNPMYRHADHYYTFIHDQLIPFIRKTYPTNDRRSLLGHSFGGLFVVWCLLSKADHCFQNYFALSPSLWKNNYNMFDYEEAYHQHHQSLNAHLYLSTGGRENLNLIRSSVRRMKGILEERKYQGFRMDYAEHAWKTHSTQVPVSMAYIMRTMKF